MAERLLALAGDEDEDGPPPPRTMAGYSEEIGYLLDIKDAIRAMHATLIAANSEKGKGPEVKPTPRPVTAFDRARRRRNFAQAMEVRDKFSPRPAGESA